MPHIICVYLLWYFSSHQKFRACKKAHDTTCSEKVRVFNRYRHDERPFHICFAKEKVHLPKCVFVNGLPIPASACSYATSNCKNRQFYRGASVQSYLVVLQEISWHNRQPQTICIQQVVIICHEMTSIYTTFYHSHILELAKCAYVWASSCIDDKTVIKIN